MSSWGERMTSMVSSCGPRSGAQRQALPYYKRLEKVKFGVPLDQVCKNNTQDIPGPLLVMLLKLNKEGPFKKDVFRAPGHQGNMRKLVHFLQQGRLVNIHSFSVNTIASVLKKFLRKIPGGVFGPENEAELFEIIKQTDTEMQIGQVQRIFMSLPVYTQHLLVLLFGTFRVIHSNSETAQTGMTAEALGVSVAPSFFHTCVAAGKTAKMEDVERFKLATKVTKFFIEHFGRRDLFGRENYEYYAKLTGRILKVEDEYIFFTYPPAVAGHYRSRDDTDPSLDPLNRRHRSASPGAGVGGASACGGGGDDAEVAALKEKTGSLEIIPENCPLDPAGRLSISLDDQNVSSPSSVGSPGGAGGGMVAAGVTIHRGAGDSTGISLRRSGDPVSGAEFRIQSGRGPGEVKSYTCLPQVHRKQEERMRHRSEWFLSDPSGLVTVKCGGSGTGKISAFATAPRRIAAAAVAPSPSSVATMQHPFIPVSIATPSSVCDTSTMPPSSTTAPSTSTTPSALTTASSSALQPPPSRQQQQPASLPTSFPQQEPHNQQPPSLHGSLRRRLSDKDKERRLVRRSSSKRKDKENGGNKDSPLATPTGGSGRGSGRGSSTALETVLSGQLQAASVGATLAAALEAAGSPGRPALKRAGSADAHQQQQHRGSIGSLAATTAAGSPSVSQQQQQQQQQHGTSHHTPHHHPVLCRTGSQDTPHHHHPNLPPLQAAAAAAAAAAGTATGSPGGSSQSSQHKLGSGAESPSTRSMPRI